MAGAASFDVVSEFDRQELVNALDQVRREVATRYDFKGAKVVRLQNNSRSAVPSLAAANAITRRRA